MAGEGGDRNQAAVTDSEIGPPPQVIQDHIVGEFHEFRRDGYQFSVSSSAAERRGSSWKWGAHGRQTAGVNLSRMFSRAFDARRHARQRSEHQSADAEQDADEAKVAPLPVQIELIHRPASVQEHAGQHEQCRLGEAVADDVDRRSRQAGGTEQPDAAQKDPDVADGREGQQPFDVALGEAHDGPEYGGGGPEGCTDPPL